MSYWVQGSDVLGWYVVHKWQWVFKHEDKAVCDKLAEILNEGNQDE